VHCCFYFYLVLKYIKKNYARAKIQVLDRPSHWVEIIQELFVAGGRELSLESKQWKKDHLRYEVDDATGLRLRILLRK